MQRAPFRSPELFPVKVTDISAAPAYQWVEVWDAGTGALVQKTGGRYGNASNPGVDVLASTFTLNQIVWCRAAEGRGNLRWELFSMGGGGGGSAPVGVCVNDSYNMTSVDTWENTGKTLTLPGAGTYRVQWQSMGQVVVSAGSGVAGLMFARLWNQTTGAEVVTSDGVSSSYPSRVVAAMSWIIGNAGVNNFLIDVVPTVTGADVLRLELFLNTFGGFLTYSLSSCGINHVGFTGATGTTRKTYQKIP